MLVVRDISRFVVRDDGTFMTRASLVASMAASAICWTDSVHIAVYCNAALSCATATATKAVKHGQTQFRQASGRRLGTRAIVPCH
jgi:hypothetical protein